MSERSLSSFGESVAGTGSGLLFIVAMCFFLAGGAIMLWRNLSLVYRTRRMRAMLSLLVHMLQSHLVGLKLFLNRLEPGGTVDAEMAQKALSVADELHVINQRILASVRSFWPPDMVPLRSLFVIVAGRHGDVRLVLDDRAGRLLVPNAQFQLVFDELLTNARDAVAHCDAPDILLEARLYGRFLRRKLIVTVSDNGVGIAPELLEEVTTPFFSTRRGHHLGLGLTCCKELMRSMSGHFDVISTPGKGTRVEIIYPLCEIGM